MDSVFDQPGINWMIAIVGIIEMLSLIVTLLIALMYRRARHRLAGFFDALNQNGAGVSPHELNVFPPVLWGYVLLTVVVTVLTILLFLFQPHWL